MENLLLESISLLCVGYFFSQDALFGRYIHAPTGHRLHDTICKFCNIIGLPNVVGAINGIHIPLSYKPQRGLIPMLCDVFNRKKFHSVLLQAMCNSERFFKIVCAGQSDGLYDAGPKFTHNYEDEIYWLNRF